MVILFVSHIHFLQEAILSFLRSSKDIEVFGAPSRESAEALALQADPDLLVIDSSHPEAMALVAAIQLRLATISVVVLAMCDQDEEFFAWANTGIRGYVGPESSLRDLASTLRRVGAGEVVCPPRLTALLLNQFAERSCGRAAKAGIHGLTRREREVVHLLAEGLPDKQIAHRLTIMVSTVKNHVHSILSKWNARSRGEAAACYRLRVREMPQTGKASPRVHAGRAGSGC